MKLTERDIELFKFYNEVAEKYPPSKLIYGSSGYAAHRARFIKSLLKKKRNALTLDLGCADGFYRSSIRRYVGLDIGLARLQRFKGNRIWATALFLPFANCVFDRVLLSELLEHIWRRKIVLDECYRVLKQDGELVFSAPYGRNPHHIQRKWTMLKEYGVEYCPYIHGHFSVWYTKKLLSKSGFNIEMIRVLSHRGPCKNRFVVAVAKRVNTC